MRHWTHPLIIRYVGYSHVYFWCLPFASRFHWLCCFVCIGCDAALCMICIKYKWNTTQATNHVSLFRFVWNMYGYGIIWLVDVNHVYYPVNLKTFYLFTNKLVFIGSVYYFSDILSTNCWLFNVFLFNHTHACLLLICSA